MIVRRCTAWMTAWMMGRSDIVGLIVKKNVMIEWRTFGGVVVDVSEFTEAIHAEGHA